jgi:hypothetical protein
MSGFAHFACQVGRKHQNGPSEIRRFHGRSAARFRDGLDNFRREGHCGLRLGALAREAFHGRKQDGNCR